MSHESTPAAISPVPTIPTNVISTTIAGATASPSGGGGGGGTQNSPLLFFVALGFGVVFTNLWIIVGVKYCFRYNARNRARANGVDEVDLQALGARPHRRRREKKLMAVDEVNERFPVTKYKTWRANREVMGLPTAGGIAPTDGSTPIAVTDQTTTDLDPPASPLPKIPEPVADPTKPITPERDSQDQPDRPIQTETPITTAPQPQSPAAQTTTAPTTTTTTTTTTTATATQPPADRSSTEIRRVQSNPNSDNDADHDDDEPMPALPADMANSCGDTCAICIDNLEDIDDVRGLTCGHAFHTACIDPWLTARRACCPLCKADYYVPKPRTEAEIEAEEQARERRRQQAAELNRHPLSSWWYRAERYLTPPGSRAANNNNANNRRSRTDARRSQRSSQGPRWNPFGGRNAGSNATGDAPAPDAANPETQQTSSTGSSAFLSRFSRRGRSSSAANAPAAEPTPSTLEAGLANPNAASSTR